MRTPGDPTGFERHAFISYAQSDNRPLPAQKDGWVTIFHQALQQLLSQFLGINAAIWRDDKLRGNDVFAEEIFDTLRRTAVLVSVITPRYLNSEWCTKEIAEFCRVAQQSGGVLVENKSRVFKVIKTPIQTEEPLPSIVGQMLGYEFFQFDKDGTPRELDPVFGEETARQFLQKVYKLAWDIKQLLDHLGRAEGSNRSTNAEKAMLYLAECGVDQREAREALAAELVRYGYAVLPDRQLPSNEAEYVAAAEQLLARCSLSIHLVGSSGGMIPDGPGGKPVVALQNELAVKRARSGALKRVIWLPSGTRSELSAQQLFIEELQKSAEAQFGAELVVGDFENLKAVVRAALKVLEAPAGPELAAGQGGGANPKVIYVRCDEKDRIATVPLLKFLKSRGFEVRLPVFTGAASEVREANRDLFMSCDAILLFYGAGDESWKYYQQNELKRVRGQRRARPFIAEYTYLAPPATQDKELLLTLEEPQVIDGRGGFSEQAVAAFLGAVGPGRATR